MASDCFLGWLLNANELSLKNESGILNVGSRRGTSFKKVW